MTPVNAALRRAASSAFALLAFLSALPAPAQNVVPVGSGSYADGVQAADQQSDSYYGLPANQVAQFYSFLHLDPTQAGKPIPTDHWWTDLLVGNRSTLPSGQTQYILQQDLYGGNMWFTPGMIDPQSYGFDLYFPNSWKAANADGSPQGGFDKGPSLQVHGDVPYHIPTGDILLADFENGYPAGTVITGTGFGATPSSNSTLVNKMGQFCATTTDGGNTPTGLLRLPDFVVSKHYLHFLICGGNTTATQVRLMVNGSAVLQASGANSRTFAWVTWDISPYANSTAHIEVSDTATGAWGWIACDQIVESDSNNPVGRFGGDLVGLNSVVNNWGDWNVDYYMPDGNGNKMTVTMARGIPFTWTTWTGMKPKLMLGADTTFYDTAGNPITVTSGSFVAASFAFTYQNRVYGIFLPDNVSCTVSGSGTTTYLEPQLSGANNYMVIGYLPATSNLAEFAGFAYAKPTNTQISWNLDLPNARVTTNWTITTTALKGTNLNTIQGWLPHHYHTTTNNLSFKPYTYLTQRGTMKCASGQSFQINFPFQGIAPMIPAPVVSGLSNDYQPSRMTTYLSKFNPGSMLGETYGSGKALGLCAAYMAIADQVGDTTDFNRFESALRTSLQNWLTYTPGESNGYFAQYPDWHALIGFDASYGSQAFNDLHFHYGYFTVAAAELGRYDQTFLTNYGPMMKLVVKCFANWDRTDTSEPFLRMFDVWEGHSNAGGFSSSTGENQEASSEAMNSWVGVYLLGGMLQDSQMTAAGAMGFAIESAATNEYWEDLYQTNFPTSYGRAWAGQVWSSSINYGTYFSGDPAWVYAIQMVPSNHWNNYLVRAQNGTASAKYQSMWNERANYYNKFPVWNSTTAYASGTWVGFNGHIYSAKVDVPAGQASPDTNTASWSGQGDYSASTPDVLGGYPGDYVLSYQAIWDHTNTPAMFDSYYSASKDIATNNSWAGQTYYLIHSMRQFGDQDFTYTVSIPTAAVYFNSSTSARKAVIYNPSASAANATIYHNGSSVQTVSVPAHSQVVAAVTAAVVNLSLNQPASASTVQTGNAAANANDSSSTTRWAAASATMPQWWLVDLGANKSLARTDINWYSNSTRSYQYKIEVSTDNVNFSTAVDKTTNAATGPTSDSYTAIARYVRVTVTGCSTAGAFASAYDISVFGN